jgi:hypothetical protein
MWLFPQEKATFHGTEKVYMYSENALVQPEADFNGDVSRNGLSIFCGWIEAVFLNCFDCLPVQIESGGPLNANVLRNAIRVNNKRDDASCLEGVKMLLLDHLPRRV